MQLFFYGVLLEGLGEWPFLEGIGPGRRATTRGRLFGLRGTTGWYPALVPGDGLVIGAVHEAGMADIASMDAFEGVDYLRTPIQVEADGQQIEANAYLWVSDLPDGSEHISHGDFARWLAESGRNPITG